LQIALVNTSSPVTKVRRGKLPVGQLLKEKDVLTGICYSFIAKFCVLFPKPEKKNKYKKT